MRHSSVTVIFILTFLQLPASGRFMTRHRHSRRLKRTPRPPELSLRTRRSASREPERVNSDTSDPSGLQMAEAFLAEAREEGEGQGEETVCPVFSFHFQGFNRKEINTPTHIGR